MGSLENGVSIKQTNQSLGKISSFSKINRPRSRFPRSLLSKRLGYFQWISTIVIFFLFLVFFQSFLPGSMVDTPVSTESGERLDLFGGDLMYLKKFSGLDFGESLRFEPVKVLAQFRKGAKEVNYTKNGVRFGYRKPKLALVFADLVIDSYQVLMVTVASALQEIGYSIEVFSSEDGPAHAAWAHIGVPISIMQGKDHIANDVDWLNYDGVLLNSLEGKNVLSCLMQEPFNSVPLVWTIHEKNLATRLSRYSSNGTVLHDWRKSFNRANVVVFPNYALPIIYSTLDAGNYFVIPGAPAEAWEANSLLALKEKHMLKLKMGVSDDDLIVTIVGSHFMYKGLWLEHALVLQALKPLLEDLPSGNGSSLGLKIFVLTEDSTGNYTKAIEVIAASLKYPKGVVKHADHGPNADDILMNSDLVIYGSFLEERSFPDILIKAMCYEKLVIAPNLSIIQKYIDDRVNGLIFPKEDIKVLTSIISEVVSRGKLSPLAHNIASIGKETAKNLLVSDVVEGYALLLENILKLPSEVTAPKAAAEIPAQYRSEWPWNILNIVPNAKFQNRNTSSWLFIEMIEGQQNHNKTDASISKSSMDDDFIYSIWEEQKQADVAIARKRREDQEIKGRSDQSRGTWEDVYRNSKRADRLKNDLHERDDGELERTGQPLCIYEPYFGKGTWPFLHLKPLYRGVSLIGRGRRPGADDVDAPSRLPLLSDSYYRDLLGEFGAFFAIANHVDRVHKNPWIGFQSWRATAKKAVLSKIAEKSLMQTIEAHKHGDALYFWVRMDTDPRNPLKRDFWSFCDAINAGNCRSAFSDAFKRTYGLKDDGIVLPPMPMDGGTWSVMHSWVLPTRSFLEFVMFSRMFVDALDAEMYDEHHQNGVCNLSLSKDKHCYSRVLELLVNVWAYHSARRIIYIDPDTGVMQEHHILHNRRGKMWIKWFQLHTLKSMDEDLAEEADSDTRRRRWLWPSTGEIFWQGVYDKERDQRKKANAERKRKNKDKVERIKHRNQRHQKPIDKYVKPPPEGTMNTTVVAKR